MKFLAKSLKSDRLYHDLRMKKIAIQAAPPKSSIWNAQFILRFLYMGVLLMAFSFFSMYARFTGWLFSSHKIDIFNDLDQLAFYFRLIDEELSEQLLTFDTVLKSYLQ